MNWSKDEWKADLPQEKLNNITEMENCIESLQTDRKTLQFKVETMQAVIDKLKHNEENLKNEILEQKKDEQLLRNELVKKCENIERLEPLVKTLDHQVQLLQTQLENSKEQKENAVNRCKILESNLSLNDEDFENLKEQLKVKELFLKEQQLKANQELRAAEKKIQNFLENVQPQLIAENKLLAEQNQKSELQLNGKTNALQIEKSSVNSLKEEIKDLEKTIDEMKREKSFENYNNPGIANSSWNLDVFKLRKKVNELEVKNSELLRCLENNKRNVMSLTQTYEEKMSPMKYVQGNTIKLPPTFISPSRCKSDPTLYSILGDQEPSCRRSLNGKNCLEEESGDCPTYSTENYVVSMNSSRDMPRSETYKEEMSNPRVVGDQNSDSIRNMNLNARKNFLNNGIVNSFSDKGTSTDFVYRAKFSQDVAVGTSPIKTHSQQTATNSITTNNKLSQTQMLRKEQQTERHFSTPSTQKRENHSIDHSENEKHVFRELLNCLESIKILNRSILLQSDNVIGSAESYNKKECNTSNDLQQLASIIQKSLKEFQEATKINTAKWTAILSEKSLAKKATQQPAENCEYSSPGKVKELAAGWEKNGMIKSAVKEFVRERQQINPSEVNNCQQAQGSRANDFQHSVKCLLLWQQLCESKSTVAIYEKEIAALKFQIKQLKLTEQPSEIINEPPKYVPCLENNETANKDHIQQRCFAQHITIDSKGADVANRVVKPLSEQLKILERNHLDNSGRIESCLERIELRLLKLENEMDSMPPLVKNEISNLSKNMKVLIEDEFNVSKTNGERNSSKNCGSPCKEEDKTIKIFKNVTVRSPKKHTKRISCSPLSQRSSSPGIDVLKYFDEMQASSGATRNAILTLFARVDELEAEKKRLHDNHLTYTTKLSSKDEQIRELETKLAEANRNVSEKDSAYKTELESLKFEQLDIYKEFKDLCETLKCKELEILNKNKLIKDIKTAIEAEKDNLRNKQEEFEAKNKDFTTQLDGYRNQLRKRNHEVEELMLKLKYSEKSFTELYTKLTSIDQIFIDCKRKSLY